MRCLVTGAAGFVGSHLTDRIIQAGGLVFGVDNLATGSMDNIRHLLSHKSFQFSLTDITKSVFVHEKVDRVYNLASPASPKDFSRIPVEILKVGSIGTLNVLELAKEHEARFLTASTSEVYGDPEVHPQREDYYGNVSTTGPRSMYDESKRFSEALVTHFGKFHGLETRIIRIFNTYGPRMRLDDGRCLPNFIVSALKNEPLVVYGDGSQTRSFCYVDDLVGGMISLMESSESSPVNIGNPSEITILEMAKEVIELTGSKSKIEFAPAMKDDPTRRRPDISKAKSILNWEPIVSREEGVRKTVADFLDRL
jgi:dTDP-glucose 4,6-dehydratase